MPAPADGLAGRLLDQRQAREAQSDLLATPQQPDVDEDQQRQQACQPQHLRPQEGHSATPSFHRTPEGVNAAQASSRARPQRSPNSVGKRAWPNYRHPSPGVPTPAAMPAAGAPTGAAPARGDRRRRSPAAVRGSRRQPRPRPPRPCRADRSAPAGPVRL